MSRLYDLLLNYLYHNTLIGHNVSEANYPAREASLAKFCAKCQYFASKYQKAHILMLTFLNVAKEVDRFVGRTST